MISGYGHGGIAPLLSVLMASGAAFGGLPLVPSPGRNPNGVLSQGMLLYFPVLRVNS